MNLFKKVLLLTLLTGYGYGTTYENAEDGDTNGWTVYDSTPEGAYISNVYDKSKSSKVIKFVGDETNNGYILGNWEGETGAWNNTTQQILKWQMKFDGDYIIYVRVMTEQGARYIYYTPSDESFGLNGGYIHIGLGIESNNGQWQDFLRDLSEDLQKFEPDNRLVSVNAFLVRGNGYVDDIKLLEKEAELLFSSGFEGGVYIDPYLVPYSEDYKFIRGEDSKTHFSWPIQILDSNVSETALHILDNDKDNTLLTAKIEDKTRNGKTTKVLYNKLTGVKPKNEETNTTYYTQLPYEINGIKKGKSDLYIRYKMKIDGNMLGVKNEWRALFEYKTKDYKDVDENGTGFRLISYIYTDEKGNASWHIKGDKDPDNDVWSCDSLIPTKECNNFASIPVITNEWFFVEYYWHWSNKKDGHVVWKINGQIVGEQYDATTLNDNPINFIMLTQIYGGNEYSTAQYPMEQWVDDIEIWDDIPPMSLYENAEDSNIDGWKVYDISPKGAYVSNVYDEGKHSKVIKFVGDGTNNGYILGNWEGETGAWNNTTQHILKWHMKFDDDYIIYVRVMTEQGERYIYYTPSDESFGLNGDYIHIGLGTQSHKNNKGNWQGFVRDLAEDLQRYEPNNSLIAVNAFLVRGNISLDNIELSK